jgi:TnpA family transposase
MPNFKILTPQEIKDFDNPPMFTAEGRKCFFYITKHARKVLDTLRTPTNQVSFLLQMGYFKAVNKFFSPESFNVVDLQYVQSKLNLSATEIALGNYTETTCKRHRDMILEELGYKRFEFNKNQIKKETAKLCNKLIRPRIVLNSLLEYLKWKRIEVPKYHYFAELITESLRSSERNILRNLDKHLIQSTKEKLDQLLEKAGKTETENKLKLKRYRLTQLKKSSQSTRPLKIKENIDDLVFLEDLFHEVKHLKDKLNLSDLLIEYYAQTVIKSQSYQTDQKKETKYLYLIAFVYYQFCNLNDVLIEQSVQSVQNILNSNEREHRESYFAGREERNKNIASNSMKVNRFLVDVNRARKVLLKKTLSAEEKIKELEAIFSLKSIGKAKELQSEFKKIAEEASNIFKDKDVDDLLEKKSIKLKNRASGIIKTIEFDETASDKNLIDAINYFKEKDGKLTAKAPLSFLGKEDKKRPFDSEGKFRISLYKSLLFKAVADSIKSGALSLRYSNKYRSFNHYLIPPERWNREKNEILSRVGLKDAHDFKKIIEPLKKHLKTQFKITNENIENKNNQYVKFDKNNVLKITTPRQKEPGENLSGLKDLFPQDRLISIYEVLVAVNKVAGFTSSFEHWRGKSLKRRPKDKAFFAGIMGHGCNLGTKKLARMSHDVNSLEMEKAINWYFSNENLISANDKILALMDRLELPKEYRKNVALIHTSSDGQKLDIGVESLNANYSFKNFGQGQGVNIYGFIDESHRLFHSTVINPAEREAGYVIDGLMQNEVVKSDIHSTDTHGYSEIVFALTHLIGVSFAPRIKNMKKQQLYSFERPSSLVQQGYKITSKQMIKPELIESEWDNILRLIATIKLKESTASQLLKRLSSYSKYHPIYRALKHFGRIIKTIFLLQYIGV